MRLEIAGHRFEHFHVGCDQLWICVWCGLQKPSSGKPTSDDEAQRTADIIAHDLTRCRPGDMLFSVTERERHTTRRRKAALVLGRLKRAVRDNPFIAVMFVVAVAPRPWAAPILLLVALYCLARLFISRRS